MHTWRRIYFPSRVRPRRICDKLASLNNFEKQLKSHLLKISLVQHENFDGNHSRGSWCCIQHYISNRLYLLTYLPYPVWVPGLRIDPLHLLAGCRNWQLNQAPVNLRGLIWLLMTDWSERGNIRKRSPSWEPFRKNSALCSWQANQSWFKERRNLRKHITVRDLLRFLTSSQKFSQYPGRKYQGLYWGMDYEPNCGLVLRRTTSPPPKLELVLTYHTSASNFR